MKADLYKLYHIKDAGCVDLEVDVIYTTDKSIVKKLKETHFVTKYTKFADLENPCTMDYLNKVRAEKDQVINEMQKTIEEKDRRIFALNKRIIEMTKE